MGAEDAPENAQWRRPQNGPRQGRKRGPGSVWQYPNHEAKVGLLSLPSDAVQACQVNLEDLDQVIRDALCWERIDPKEMHSGATLSGRALEMLYTKQTTFCDDVRADFTEGALLPIVDMLLRLLVSMRRRNVEIYLPGFKVLTDLLDKFLDGKRPSDEAWMSPRLSVQWAPYFEPNEADQKLVSDRARADLEAGIIKRETAVKAVASFYGIENPAQYAEDIEEAKAAEQESLQQAQMALAEAAGKPAEPGAPPPPKPGKPVRPVTQNGKRKKPTPGKPAAPVLN
jgi:hypothetical protein